MLLLPAAGTVQVYEIESVQSDTQLTLVSAYTGATGTGKAYAIPTSPAVSIEQFAHEFASTLAYYQQQLSGWQQILTGTGNVTLTTPDGQSVTVRSQKAWDTALDGKVTGTKQADAYDPTPGVLMLNGGWGWGGVGQTLQMNDADFLTWVRTLGNRSRIFRNDTATAYSKQYSPGVLLRAGDTYAALTIGFGGVTGSGVRAVAGNNGGTTTRTYEFWTDQNLVKQSSKVDTAAGAMLINEAFGLGAQETAYGIGNLNDATRNGFFSYAANTTGAPTTIAGYGIFFGSNANWGAELALDAGQDFLRLRRKASGVWQGWTQLINDVSAQTITGKKTFNGGLEDSVTQIGKRTMTDRIILTSATVGQILAAVHGQVVLVASQLSGSDPAYLPTSNFAADDSYSYTVISRHNADQNIGIFLVTNITSSKAWFLRTMNATTFYWNEIALSGPGQYIDGSKIFQSVSIRAGSGNTGLEIGRVDGSSSSFIDFHSSGNDNDYDARIIATGGSSTVGAGALDIMASVFRWNNYNLATLQRAETFSGAKTFSQDVTISKPNPRLVFENTSNTAGEVGRVVDVQYGANTFDFIRRSASGQSTNQQAIRFSYPSSGTGIYNAVISGINAVADSNGFWKTASPVVKLFADGTSELTSEAEGITTERVSEGVYRISGCLGLNADRAWGGDEGGIDVPMCRNKLPRLWVDYGGDEGSEKINPDGSIVIRTYHRPHPEAPGFARNEIEGYANGDPIDIPHDTFISVRVQMPETEVQATVVETVPDEVTNEVVLDTSAQA